MKNVETTSSCIIDERMQKTFSRTFSVFKKTKCRFLKENEWHVNSFNIGTSLIPYCQIKSYAKRIGKNDHKHRPV